MIIFRTPYYRTYIIYGIYTVSYTVQAFLSFELNMVKAKYNSLLFFGHQKSSLEIFVQSLEILIKISWELDLKSFHNSSNCSHLEFTVS